MEILNDISLGVFFINALIALLIITYAWAIIDVLMKKVKLELKIFWLAVILMLPLVGVTLYVAIGRSRLKTKILA